MCAGMVIYTSCALTLGLGSSHQSSPVNWSVLGNEMISAAIRVVAMNTTHFAFGAHLFVCYCCANSAALLYSAYQGIGFTKSSSVKIHPEEEISPSINSVIG